MLKQVKPRWTPCNRLHQESGHMPCASMNRIIDNIDDDDDPFGIHDLHSQDRNKEFVVFTV